MSKLALRAQTIDIAYLPLHQDLLTKNVSMTAQRNFGLGNSPITLYNTVRFVKSVWLAGGGGFEPPLMDPESTVLPLDDPPETEFARRVIAY